ncbi:MAG: hypothetical protein B7Z37_11550 [Verrucomicrobia bacterium 12-59-8]|nr:MAG: hypothetical protein B7Z37_11550 [Verrucomicrobia bacterium 12-59-8]
MKILIFGAAGFIGSHLARHAQGAGYAVVCFCRSGKVRGFAGQCHSWSLGDALDEAVIAGADCALHLAHDFDGPRGAEKTLNGTIAAVRRLHQSGVRCQLVFSSYSAGPHACSLYGRTKSTLEAQVLGIDTVSVIRPGLVLGNGGLYGRIRTFVRLSPLVPLPDGGAGRVPVIEINQLCEQTLQIAATEAPRREYNLFEKELRSLRDIVQGAAREAGRSVWVIGVPSVLVLLMLRVTAALHLPMPVNADNLTGFLANQSAGHESSLEEMENLQG